MDIIKIPTHIIQIMNHLQDMGHSAYAVGGSIRDFIMGKSPQDWDLATSALPEEMLQIFGDNAIPTGIKHGTVSVKTPEGIVEITTYRTEGAYSDHRHPDEVHFVKNIIDDLARRDFTMNAMAASAEGEILDPFGGRQDIENGIIRCVGCAETRFVEDALRMLRAVRFAAVLGFEIEKTTESAIKKCSHLCKEVAAERISSELCKALLGSYSNKASLMFTYGMLDHLLIKPLDGKFPNLELVTSSLEARLSALCIFLESGKYADTESFLSSLRLPGAVQSKCRLAAEIALKVRPLSRLQWKKAIKNYGYSAAKCAADAMPAFGSSRGIRYISDILMSGECCTLSSLEVSGRDLSELGLHGADIGKALDRALSYVIEHPEHNEKDFLLNYIKETEHL